MPNTGHSVVGSDLSGCVDDELAAFAAGTAATCKANPTPISPTPRPPLQLSSLSGGTRALRTVSAVRATLNDVRRQLIGDAIAAGRSINTGARTGGLRGGVARVNGDVVELTRVTYVPGVRVSGTYAIKRGGDLAAAGDRPARGARAPGDRRRGHRSRHARRPHGRGLRERERRRHGRRVVGARARAPAVREPGSAPRRLSAMANRLAHETSPYLLQHADNPVDWCPWGPEALRARARPRPARSSSRSATRPATGAT